MYESVAVEGLGVPMLWGYNEAFRASVQTEIKE